jgi:hypothetical protein
MAMEFEFGSSVKRRWVGSGSAWLVLAASLVMAPAVNAATVAYWRFDDDGKSAGQTAGTAVDDTGTNDATGVMGPVYTNDVPLAVVPQTQAGNGLALDLERDSVQLLSVPHDASLSFGASAFTVEAWVKLETLGDPLDQDTRIYLLQKKGSAGTDKKSDYAFMVQIADRGDQATAGVGKQSGFTGRELAYTWGDFFDQFFVISNLEVDDTDWHFVSMAFDGNDSVRFGVDGTFETVTGLSALGHTTNTGELILGARTTGAGAYADPFDGKIDELRISDRVLPPGRLLDSVHSVPALPPSAAGLLAVLLAGVAGRSFARLRGAARAAR